MSSPSVKGAVLRLMVLESFAVVAVVEDSGDVVEGAFDAAVVIIAWDREGKDVAEEASGAEASFAAGDWQSFDSDKIEISFFFGL